MSDKLGKLKERLSNLCQKIDEAEQRKNDAKLDLQSAAARQELADKEKSSIERKLKLRSQDLETARKRNAELKGKMQCTEDSSAQTEEARRTLEENETVGDEKIHDLEEQIKITRVTLEEASTKLSETERKIVFVQRDITRTTNKADALQQRSEVLEGTISAATESLKELEAREGTSSVKEEENIEKLIYLEGQYKELEVRCEAANRSCQTTKRNIKEAEEEISNWNAKADELTNEINDMNLADFDD